MNRLFDAYLNYWKSDYNETYGLLFNLRLEDISYGLRYHTLLLRTLIEGEEAITFREVDFIKKCNTFRAYLRGLEKKKLLSKSLKSQSVNFMKIAKKIYFYNFSKTTKEDLLAELDNCKEIFYRVWLKAKINHL